MTYVPKAGDLKFVSLFGHSVLTQVVVNLLVVYLREMMDRDWIRYKEHRKNH